MQARKMGPFLSLRQHEIKKNVVELVDDQIEETQELGILNRVNYWNHSAKLLDATLDSRAFYIRVCSIRHKEIFKKQKHVP